jgi:hypothetical protein
VIDEPPDEDMAASVAVIEQEAGLPDLVDALNEMIALPRDVRVRVGGEEGPYYDPEEVEIVMPPSFVDTVGELFAESEAFDTDDELLEEIGSVVAFVFLHEAGHALVDQLDLPTTGREEDAVDELATVLSTRFEDGGDLGLAAALMFGLFGEERTEIAEDEFWGEHSLDEQRFYSILCHVYGSDPEEYEEIVTEAGIDDDRLEQCPQEYEQKVDAWDELLGPHLKEERS